MNRIEVPYSHFLLINLVLYLVTFTPTVFILVLTGTINFQVGVFLFTVFMITTPLSGFIAWLIARGSYWKHTTSAFASLGNLSGSWAGIFLGGTIGFFYLGEWGGIILAILLFFAGKFAGTRLAILLAKEFAF